MNDFDLEQMLQELRRELPAWLDRDEAAGAAKLKTGSMANIDSMQEGPPRVMLGRKVVYPRDAFIEWLRKRLRPIA